MVIAKNRKQEFGYKILPAVWFLLALCLLITPVFAAVDMRGNAIERWPDPYPRGIVHDKDLERLASLNLVDARGLPFDPAQGADGYSELRAWLLGGKTSSNMAYRLSILVATTDLNMDITKVDGSGSIYASTLGSADAPGYATVNTIMAEADAELELHPFTPPGSPYREYQEALAIALESANGIEKASQEYIRGTEYRSDALSVDSVSTVSESGSIEGCGYNVYGQATPPAGSNYTSVAAGDLHSLALTTDGSIVGWGWNEYNQISPMPSGNFTAISAGMVHSLGLLSDGSIVSWGDDLSPEVKDTPRGTTYVAISSGVSHCLALRSDGSIVGWGLNNKGQATPPAGVFSAIAAGELHSLALRSDGSLVSWGEDFSGQVSGTPVGNNFTAIAAGNYHSLALRSDGSIVGWGWNMFGQASPPPGNDFIAIAAGMEHSLALRSDGSTMGFGSNYSGQFPLPVAYYSAIAAGNYHSLGLRSVQQVLPVPGLATPPLDPDHDGLYEDVRGNGEVGFNDVVLFFDYVEWIRANEPVSAFDFSANGVVGFQDIVMLFNEVG